MRHEHTKKMKYIHRLFANKLPPRSETTNVRYQQALTPSTQPVIPCLPDQVYFEILTRLPVKSLVKFTTVSKSWYFLIKSPHFIKSQLSISHANPSYSHHCLLHSSASTRWNLHRTSLRSVLHDPVVAPKDVDYPRHHVLGMVSLVGSVNGLVCLRVDYDDAVFLNPCLRNFRQLPRFQVTRGKRNCPVFYGFGYDAAGDDYKLVAIFCVFKEIKHLYKNDVMVYSGKNDSWKTVQGFKEDVYLKNYGIFLNGKLHWATSGGGNVKWSIVSIDVGDESCGELDLPNFGKGKYDYELGLLGECICVLCDDGQSRADFWVMKEYGVRESWTKFASISCLTGRETDLFELNLIGQMEPKRGRYKPPLCLLNNGKMLLMFGPQSLVLYDPQDDSRSVFDVDRLHCCLDSLVYVESLVLP